MKSKKLVYFLTLLFIVVVLLVASSCEPPIYNLTALASPPNGGNVTPSSGNYTEGTSVTLTAQPLTGYRFVHWSGDAAGTSNILTFVMDKAKNITANFIAQYHLTVLVNPQNSGTVSIQNGTYDDGASIQITVQPAAGYRFSGWSGDITSGSSDINLVMSSNKTITANFIAQHTVEISVEPTGGGTVSVGDGQGVPFGKYSYDDGKNLLIKVQPSPGYVFDHWSGNTAISPDNLSSFYLLINQDFKMVAHFIGKYTSEEINQLIDQYNSGEQSWSAMQKINDELKQLGSIMTEEHINRMLEIMRAGKQTWIFLYSLIFKTTKYTYYESIAGFVSDVLKNINSPYLTPGIMDEVNNVVETKTITTPA